MILKLTKRTIDGMGSAPAVIYDTELKGFGVRLGASGKLSWFVEYRLGAGGRRVAKKLIIGPREFTPEEARQAAKKHSRDRRPRW